MLCAKMNPAEFNSLFQTVKSNLKRLVDAADSDTSLLGVLSVDEYMFFVSLAKEQMWYG